MQALDIFRHDDAHTRSFDAGETIFCIDDAADCMYVVISGAVDICIDGNVLERVEPGGLVGEMALIEQLPRSASAVAVEATKVSTVDRKRFLFLVQNHPFFARTVMEVLAQRLRRMDATLRRASPQAASR